MTRHYFSQGQSGTFDTKDLPSDEEIARLAEECRTAAGDACEEHGFEGAAKVLRWFAHRIRNKVDARLFMAEFLNVYRLSGGGGTVLREISPEAIYPAGDDRAPDDPENIPYGETISD